MERREKHLAVPSVEEDNCYIASQQSIVSTTGALLNRSWAEPGCGDGITDQGMVYPNLANAALGLRRS